tara:strand:+ start:740 stop:1072 length:333 start_codon:yes stop_codon:yes gene_type:complete
MQNELKLDNKTINQLKIEILAIVKKEGYEEQWQDIQISKKTYDVHIMNGKNYNFTKNNSIYADIYNTYQSKEGDLKTDNSKFTELTNITHPKKVILSGNMVEIDISKEAL